MTQPNNTLSPSLQALAAHLDAQPGQVQINIQYAMALLMVESGKALLTKTEPGEAGAYCTFETVAGDTFTVIKPPLSEAEEQEMAEKVKKILEEEGGL